jgi:hypothetical protein
LSYLFQALWLQQAFRLEFFGISTFFPGLWIASLIFFAVNVWILGIIVSDVGNAPLHHHPGNDEKGSASEGKGKIPGSTTAAPSAGASTSTGTGFDESKRRIVEGYMQELERMH